MPPESNVNVFRHRVQLSSPGIKPVSLVLGSVLDSWSDIGVAGVFEGAGKARWAGNTLSSALDRLHKTNPSALARTRGRLKLGIDS
jgi:hypothetical protein